MTKSGSTASRSPSISGEETRAYTLQAIAPQTFGKYTLIGRLGHGGMAEVLLAVMGGKAGFRKLVVLKRLHGQFENDPGFIDMFLDEARLAAQLDHPNCVQTAEVGEVGEQHFLAMEYLDGQGLERLLRSSAQSGHFLPVTTAVRIVADALEGLGYAHELEGFDGKPLRIVHRDVSPQNIFITYNGVVKLLDFGIAKAESNVVETRTGVVKGKYAYIAPEQALAQTIDQRADLWSMGVVLWECLTSRRLFKSTNELATLQETLRGEIRPPSDHNPEIPPELDAIVMGALQRDPDQRYQTAADFKEALEVWLESQPTPPTRRVIATLMKERFDEVQRIHKEKLAACLAAIEVGPSSIQRLVDAPSGTLSDPGISAPFANMTPSNARLIGGGPVSVTPTPMPIALPTAGQTEAGERRRSNAWKLVVVGAVALIAVLIAIAVPRYEDAGAIEVVSLAEPIAGAPTTALVVPGGPVAAPTETMGAPTEALVAPVVAVIPEAVLAQPVVEAAAPEAVVAPTEAAASETGSRRGGRRGGRSGTAAISEPPAAEAPIAPAGVEGFGFLSLVTSPWTTVTLDGRSLGDTPLMRERLPVGRHSLRLVNSEAGISETYEVEIRAGETTMRRLGLR